MVLDGIPLVRDAVRLEDYRLETVARELLGRCLLARGRIDDATAEVALGRRLLQDHESARIHRLHTRRNLPGWFR